MNNYEDRVLTRIVRGGLWFYLASIVNLISGFLYWLVISVTAGPVILGYTSAIIGLFSIISGVLNFGLGTSIRRYLGACRGERKCILEYLWSGAWFLTIIYSISGSILILLGLTGFVFGNYTVEMILFTGFLVILGVSQYIIAVLVGLVKTRILFISNVIGNMLRFSIGVLLVFAGFEWIGASIGYALLFLSQIIIPITYILKTIGLEIVFSRETIKKLLHAGFASWLPNTVILLGQGLGVVVVFTARSAFETGYYYIASIVSFLITSVGLSILNIALPVLSGLGEEKREIALKTLHISLALLSPINIYVILYSAPLLGFLGNRYLEASPILSILLISAIPYVITLCIYNFMFANEMYREALFIGLAQNIPRIILYYYLVQIYGGIGVAIAYTIGGFTGLAYALYIARKNKLYVPGRKYILLVIIPLVFLTPLYILKINYLLSFLIMFLNYIIYTRFKLLTRNDIRNLLLAIMSREKITRIYTRFKPVIDTLLPA